MQSPLKKTKKQKNKNMIEYSRQIELSRPKMSFHFWLLCQVYYCLNIMVRMHKKDSSGLKLVQD